MFYDPGSGKRERRGGKKIEKTDKNLILMSCVRVCTHAVKYHSCAYKVLRYKALPLPPPIARVNDVVCVSVSATCRAYIGVTPCILPANRAEYNIHGCYN